MPPLPSQICMSSSGSLNRSTFIYAPGAGGIMGLLYYSVLYGFTYYIRYNSADFRYELVYFQSIFNQQVLYTGGNITGPWFVNSGVAPAPTVVVGECTTPVPAPIPTPVPTPAPYILNNVTISKVTAKKVSGKG